MSWGGTMTCNIINNTGGTITNLTFQHQWDGGVDQPLPNGQPIPNGESLPLTIHVGEGSADLWTVRFTDAQGNCWFRNEEQCDVEEEDFDSGNPVNALLNAGNVGFTIKTPVSKPDSFGYDSCT